MTDNDIIKALGVCLHEHLGCEDGCPYLDVCNEVNPKSLIKDALDLINRQKAEIEEKSNKLREVLPIVAELKAEVITEFAERLKPVVCAMVDAMWDGDMIKCRVSGCRKPSHISCGSEICLEENRELWMAEINQIAKEMKEGVNNA